MITTEEQRRRLAEAGWYLASEAPGEYEKWRKDGRREAYVEIQTAPARWMKCGGDLEYVLEAASILGIAPAGMVCLPVEVAKRGSPKLSAVAHSDRAHETFTEDDWEDLRELAEALTHALKEVTHRDG